MTILNIQGELKMSPKMSHLIIFNYPPKTHFGEMGDTVMVTKKFTFIS